MNSLLYRYKALGLRYQLPGTHVANVFPNHTLVYCGSALPPPTLTSTKGETI